MTLYNVSIDKKYLIPPFVNLLILKKIKNDENFDKLNSEFCIEHYQIPVHMD